MFFNTTYGDNGLDFIMNTIGLMDADSEIKKEELPNKF